MSNGALERDLQFFEGNDRGVMYLVNGEEDLARVKRQRAIVQGFCSHCHDLGLTVEEALKALEAAKTEILRNTKC